MFKSIRREKDFEGFTLIELLITVVILAVIMGVAIPVYINNKNSADNTAAKTEAALLGKTMSDGISLGSISGYAGTADGVTPLTGSITTQTGTQAIGDAKVYYDSVGGTWCISKKVGSSIWMSTSSTVVATSSATECQSSTSTPTISLPFNANLVIANVRRGELNFSWSPAPGAPGDISYDVLVKDSSGVYFSTGWDKLANYVSPNGGSLTDTFISYLFTDTTLIGKTFDFRIQTTSQNSGLTTLSDPVTFTFLDIPTVTPDTPTNFQTNPVWQGINLTWTSTLPGTMSKPITGYNIYKDVSGSPVLLGSTDQAFYSVTGLSKNTDYTYYLSAYGSGGESALSAPITDRTSPWQPISGFGTFYSYLSSSTTGSNLFTSSSINYYTSTDTGSTWTSHSPSVWCDPSGGNAASSADGSIVAFTRSNDYICLSTDYGHTFTKQVIDAGNPGYPLDTVAMSSDGSVMAVGGYNNYLYTSTNSGATWTARTARQNTRSISMSSDGAKMVAATDNNIYTSTDSGATWQLRHSSSGSQYLRGTASSSNGSKLYVVADGAVFVSSDSGTTWATTTGIGSPGGPGSISTSADGSKVVLFAGRIYASSNSGTTFTAQDSSRDWNSIVISPDGSNRFARTFSDDNLYVYNP